MYWVYIIKNVFFWFDKKIDLWYCFLQPDIVSVFKFIFNYILNNATGGKPRESLIAYKKAKIGVIRQTKKQKDVSLKKQ